MKFFLRICDATAGAAQCECGSDYDRKTDLGSKCLSILDGSNDLRRYDRLAYGLHRVFEHLTVLSLVDALRGRSQKLNVMLV